MYKYENDQIHEIFCPTESMVVQSAHYKMDVKGLTDNIDRKINQSLRDLKNEYKTQYKYEEYI